jgi:glutamyl-tRNA(Gln) amidotransferase subunit D
VTLRIGRGQASPALKPHLSVLALFPHDKVDYKRRRSFLAVMTTVEAQLKAAGVAVGDAVRVESSQFQGEGRIMPHHAFSAPDILILKLASGYNVGLRLDPKAKLTKTEAVTKPPTVAPTMPAARGKPKVAILGTGGTIASFVDYRTGAVHPAATAKELAFATPEIFEHADVEADVVFQKFSEDLDAADWQVLAERVVASFGKGARGVVIPHGTDTLSFTAAALAFMLRDLPGPVVLVGAQRSSDRPSSDAAANLTAAVRLAGHADLGEVVVCMHEGTSDDRIAIHRGVRVRKNHTSRRDAFQSLNAVPLGHIDAKGIHLEAPHRARAAKGPRHLKGWQPDVGFIHSYPGLDAKAIESNMRKGLVVAGTGLGHVPRACLEAVGKAIAKGGVVAMTSQCLWGRTNLNVYSTGRDLLLRGVLDMGDVLPEVAFVKLQHALGIAKSAEEVRKIMTSDQVGETDPSTPLEGGPRR